MTKVSAEQGKQLLEFYQALKGSGAKLSLTGNGKFMQGVSGTGKKAFAEAMKALENPSTNIGFNISKEGKIVADVLVKDGKEVQMAAKATIQVPEGNEKNFFNFLAKLVAKKDAQKIEKPVEKIINKDFPDADKLKVAIKDDLKRPVVDRPELCKTIAKG